jgi:LCP family protein required for cell wall assembly
LLIATNVMLVVACVGSAAALTQIRSTIGDVPVVDIGSSLTPAAEVTEPRNFLIIGTDSAARIEDTDVITEGRDNLGELADVIMILRVDPRDNSAKLLSIPRDSRVEVAPNWGTARINSAISGVNGPRNLVQTIKRNFGISIDNYVQIDFQSFRDLVEVLDGVPVYFTTPVRDRESGLYIDEPGCRMLDEVQAWRTHGPATSSSRSTAVGTPTSPATTAASPASRTSSSVRCAEPPTRACATRPRRSAW